MICQSADLASTVYALNHGAMELNPILAGMSWPWLVVTKTVMTALLVVYNEEIGEEALATVNVITCGAAVNNVLVVK